MKKLIRVAMLTLIVGCAESNSVFRDKSENVVFPETYEMPYKVSSDCKSRYAPTSADTELANFIIEEQIEILNSQRLNQGPGCPVIHNNLKKYARQYVGFKNDAGEKILWVNFVWKSKVPDYFAKDIVFILDGCSYYWQIEVNISKKIAYNLTVNEGA